MVLLVKLMLSASTKVTLGALVGFLSGLGILGVSATDAQILTGQIDSIIGGALAVVSLVGFIEHHIQAAKQEKQVLVVTGQTTQV